MANVARDAWMISGEVGDTYLASCRLISSFSDETEARSSLSFPPAMIVKHTSYQ